MYGKNPDLAQNIRVAGINSVMGMLSFNLLLTGDTVMNGYNKEHPLKAHRGKFHHLKKNYVSSGTLFKTSDGKKSVYK